MQKTLKFLFPFYFESTKKKDNDGFPQKFPFYVRFEKTLGIFHQKNSRELEKLLDKVYIKGSMLSGGMNDAVVGPARVEEAFSFIKQNFKFRKTTTILEIGCGEGQVLKKLAHMGIKCVGLEPGPQVLQIKDKNISLINDFFPSKQIKGKYNLILHFGVLEHMAHPVKFLKQQVKFLADDGAIFLAVPNCEYDLEAGDISVFLHEHYNYFTKFGLQKTAKAAGLFLEKIIIGDDGSFLYAKLSKRKTIQKKKAKNFSEKKFEKEINNFTKKIKRYFSNEKQSDIAVYCPLRAMNLLSSLEISDCRLVDDNKNLYNKFLPTFNKKIENFEDLKNNPPKKILIYSRTFGDKIKNKCMKTKELQKTLVQTIGELT